MLVEQTSRASNSIYSIFTQLPHFRHILQLLLRISVWDDAVRYRKADVSLKQHSHQGTASVRHCALAVMIRLIPNRSVCDLFDSS